MTLKNFSSDNKLLLSLCAEATLNHWSFEGQELSVNLTTYDDDELIIIIRLILFIHHLFSLINF